MLLNRGISNVSCFQQALVHTITHIHTHSTLMNETIVYRQTYAFGFGVYLFMSFKWLAYFSEFSRMHLPHQCSFCNDEIIENVSCHAMDALHLYIWAGTYVAVEVNIKNASTAASIYIGYTYMYIYIHIYVYVYVYVYSIFSICSSYILKPGVQCAINSLFYARTRFYRSAAVTLFRQAPARLPGSLHMRKLSSEKQLPDCQRFQIDIYITCHSDESISTFIFGLPECRACVFKGGGTKKKRRIIVQIPISYEIPQSRNRAQCEHLIWESL